MRRIFYALFTLFLLLYGGAHYYLGIRFLAFALAVPWFATWVYWGAAILGASLPLVTRKLKLDFSSRLSAFVSAVSNYWLAIAFHSVVLWGVIDLVRLLVPSARANNFLWGLGVLSVLCLVFAYGYRQARVVRISRYKVFHDKYVHDLSSLCVAVVSDLHLGTPVNNARLAELVERIQALSPDIVFFMGDIIDGEIGEFAAEEMPRLLRRLTPRLGCFAVLGNHERLLYRVGLGLGERRFAPAAIVRLWE